MKNTEKLKWFYFSHSLYGYNLWVVVGCTQKKQNISEKGFS